MKFLNHTLLTSWPHLRGVMIGIFLVSFILHSLLFIKREIWFSSATPVTYARLYCSTPNVSSIRSLGNGMVELTVSGARQGAVIGAADGIQYRHNLDDIVINLSLRPGFNEIDIALDNEIRRLNLMYTPQEIYRANANRAAKYDGIIGIYPSSVCIGQSVLPIDGWRPAVISSSISPSPSTQWERTFIEVIRLLESRRGVPDDGMENASLDELVNRIEQKSSHGWCTQIAKYTVAKLEREIPVRLISIGGVVDGDNSLRTGGHMLLEVFDPVQRRWALSDPTNYLLAIEWLNGSLVNAADLQRVFSLHYARGLSELRFRVVNPSNNKISIKSFHALPSHIQRDLAFYFSSDNTVIYFSGSSSIYTQRLIDKIGDWLRLDRQFMLRNNVPAINIAKVRVCSFWIAAVLAMGLCLGELTWRIARYRFRKKNAFRASE